MDEVKRETSKTQEYETAGDFFFLKKKIKIKIENGKEKMQLLIFAYKRLDSLGAGPFSHQMFLTADITVGH